MSIELTKFDQRAVAGLCRLRNNPDFQEAMAWVNRKLAEQRELNDMLTGDQLLWSQGKCQALKKILDAPGTAVEIMKNAR